MRSIVDAVKQPRVKKFELPEFDTEVYVRGIPAGEFEKWVEGSQRDVFALVAMGACSNENGDPLFADSAEARKCEWPLINAISDKIMILNKLSKSESEKKIERSTSSVPPDGAGGAAGQVPVGGPAAG